MSEGDKYKWKQPHCCKFTCDITLYVFIFHFCNTASPPFPPPRLSIRLVHVLMDSVTRIPFLNQSGVTQKRCPHEYNEIENLDLWFHFSRASHTTLTWCMSTDEGVRKNKEILVDINRIYNTLIFSNLDFFSSLVIQINKVFRLIQKCSFLLPCLIYHRALYSSSEKEPFKWSHWNLWIKPLSSYHCEEHTGEGGASTAVL